MELGAEGLKGVEPALKFKFDGWKNTEDCAVPGSFAGVGDDAGLLRLKRLLADDTSAEAEAGTLSVAALDEGNWNADFELC